MVAGSTFAIRLAKPEDLASLLALYRHLNADDQDIAPEFAAKRFLDILNHPGMSILLGLADGSPVASVTLVVIPNLTRGASPYALIENVVTHAGHRNQGYARRLMHHAFSAAWRAGCYKVMLLSGSKDPATLRFYGNCGLSQSKTGFQIRRPENR